MKGWKGNKTNMETKEKMQELVKSLKGTRENNRDELIKEISLNFIAISKSQELLTFPRDQINSLFDNAEVKKRTQQTLVSQILSFLESNNLIREDVVVKAVYSFRNKPLISFDYGSYEMLMKKNGYKKTETGYSSTRKREQQGVYTNGNKSVVKDFCYWSEKKVYTII